MAADPLPGTPARSLPGDAWPQPSGGWPPGTWRVPYLGSATPGSDVPRSWLAGSNCQRFAYGVLALFGLACPPFRSSDLWADRAAAVIASEPQPLDLVLFNGTTDTFGAHLGVWMAPDEVLHLSREVGIPALWALADFAARPRYITLIGFKRVIARSL